ncbi:MAG: ABC transporter ATP-binding protein [Spirochaetes bacterium]|nr:ABC transporter ATP-binding protein [Spirochaetota bacterium]
MNTAILQVEDLYKDFGGLRALSGVSFTLKEGEITALIGPNGAGKTTLFNCITGFTPVTKGKILYRGKNITNWPPHKVVRHGLARTFQVVQILDDMTVEENVMVGAFLHEKTVQGARLLARKALQQSGIDHYTEHLAGSLPIPAKKRLEIAMALVTKPTLLMLDESMAGLTPTEFRDVQELILNLKKEGVTLVVVEHVMEAIMPICDRVLVLNLGVLIAQGTAKEVAENPDVIKAYLGDKYARNR